MSYSWQDDAKCKGLTELFYGPDEETHKARYVRIKKAKAFCEDCPVRLPCLRYALEIEEREGVWGGFHVGHGGDKRQWQKRRAKAVKWLEEAS